MPVTVGFIDIEELRKDRDQLWAEALLEYEKGTPWHVRAAEAAFFKNEQDARYIGDAYEDRIRNWLDDVEADGQKQEVTTGQILMKALSLEVAKWTLPEQQRVGRIMARIGWPRKQKGGRGSREWIYVRPEAGNE